MSEVRDFLKDVPLGFYSAKGEPNVCWTVKDLIEALQRVPERLPVFMDDEPVILTIYNAMKSHDHVGDDEIHLTIEAWDGD